ncbi:hypothetical protein [Brevundimonas guildfordensis]|uniref:Spore coat protein U domain-containing protein n=1 Tax=Brevundimonas guildfordensis TaxID=2762241 RepID=A0ABR8QXF9_9CAUL|nr:hypothetical protein [Brevundimonas guildfordensis]MBD7940225.1 hypothetical protein [Brevundimonas guildfordensis]
MSVLQKRAAAALAGIALIASLAAAGAAAAQASRPSSGCLLRIEPQLARWEIRGYDPYGGDAAFASFDIAWSNEGEAPCDGEVEVNTRGLPFGLRPDTGPSGRWSTLPYSLTDEYSAVDLTPVVGRSQSRPGAAMTLQPGARVVRRYRFEVDVDQLSRDGLFEQTVQFAFRSKDNRITVDKLLVLALNVQPSAVMGLRGAFIRTDGGGRIELGELAEGGTNLPLQVWVKSTGGYRVAVSSRNKGRLVLAEDSSWWVPYRLSLGNRPINLGVGGQVESRTGTGLGEDAYDLQLQVGETARRRAGLYSDLIELTVAPI